ncbi:TPA: hypothetical protein EYP44_01640 [Candidatus Bathyarchaeota archaeon]|nr:hypothetical protein [Candidatus Bathyarchaeota archaeon]
MDEAWFDISIIRCPHCGRLYAESSWYTIEIGSDIDCGFCGETFNAKKAVIDRVLLRIDIEEGKVGKVAVAERLLSK